MIPGQSSPSSMGRHGQHVDPEESRVFGVGVAEVDTTIVEQGRRVLLLVVCDRKWSPAETGPARSVYYLANSFGRSY